MAITIFKPLSDRWVCRHFGHKFGEWNDSPYGNSDYEVVFRECLWCGGQEWRKQSRDEIRAQHDAAIPRPPDGFLEGTRIPGRKYPPILKADPSLLSLSERERWLKEQRRK